MCPDGMHEDSIAVDLGVLTVVAWAGSVWYKKGVRQGERNCVRYKTRILYFYLGKPVTVAYRFADYSM